MIESQLITAEQWQHVLERQNKDSRKVEDIMVEERLLTPLELVVFNSLRLGVPFVNLKKQEANPAALELVPEAIARRYGVLPFDIADGGLVVVMADAEDIKTIDDLAAVTGKRIEPVLGLRQDIQDAVDRHYRASEEIEKQLSQLPTQSSRAGQAEARISADAIVHAPVVRAVDLLIRQGVRDRASDIHIEPQENRLRVRFRIDGILHEALSLPLDVHPPLTSRLKIMASMNIAERRRPQDGQITFPVGDKEVDIRVATSNTVYGEMMVLRILDKSFALYALSDLGFLPQTLERYRQLLKTPFGMILLGGPTGSGKTTTLYASINQLDSLGRNIITVEDPVEYHFADINQMQVNPQAGVTFATGLRAIMRLDPNIILVGEIRDRETVQIAIQAALTGHLVLSSVHANDTVGVLFRLIDLGAEPFLVASAVIGIVAQRMVRRVCPHCSRLTPALAAEEQLAYEKEMGEHRTEFLYGSGCNLCANTGYLGRTGIFEVMVVGEAIRRMIVTGASSDDIRAQATKDGTTSLWHDGMLKVKTGVTTPYEVIRNVFSIGR